MKTKQITPSEAAAVIMQMLESMSTNGRIEASQKKSEKKYSLNFVSRTGLSASFVLHTADKKGGRK